MTIGEKIVHLRIVNNISQEELAKILKVSRQSMSKWENGENLPPLTAIKDLCAIFKVTADELIDDNIVIHKGYKLELPNEHIKTKYFGTDGFRGEANELLNSDRAYKIGRFLGWFYSNPKYNMQKPGYRAKIVIGKDTRRSSYMLEYAVAAGAASSGADVELLHVTTTPSVSYIVRQDCFDCGVMITASHNPFYDNGIKVINGNGEKLEEDYLQPGVVTDVTEPGFNDFVVPENCVFAMGDNRTHSTDCRAFGCIPLNKIESKVWIRIWPLNLFGKVK